MKSISDYTLLFIALMVILIAMAITLRILH